MPLKRLLRLLILSFFVVVFLYIGDLLYGMNLKKGAGHVGYVIYYEGAAYFTEDETITPEDMSDYLEAGTTHHPQRFFMVAILRNSGLQLAFNRIKSGDKVRIWYEEVLESNPAQIDVIDIEKVDE